MSRIGISSDSITIYSFFILRLQWKNIVLIAGTDPDGYCASAAAALITVTNNILAFNLREFIQVPEIYGPTDIKGYLDKIKITGRSKYRPSRITLMIIVEKTFSSA